MSPLWVIIAIADTYSTYESWVTSSSVACALWMEVLSTS
jgi:hypothetical protein